MFEFAKSKGMEVHENGGVYVRGESYDARKRMEIYLIYKTLREGKGGGNVLSRELAVAASFVLTWRMLQSISTFMMVQMTQKALL